MTGTVVPLPAAPATPPWPHVVELPLEPRRRRGWLVRRALAVADLVGLAIAFAVAERALGLDDQGRMQVAGELAVFLAALPGWVVAAKLSGLYDHDEERADHSTAEDLVGVFQTMSAGVWLFVIAAQLTGLAETNLPKIALFWALGIVSVSLARTAARAACRRNRLYVQRTLIVGAGTVGAAVARKAVAHPEYGLEVVGYVDGNPLPQTRGGRAVPVAGGLDELPDLVRRLRIDRVIFAFPGDETYAVLDALRKARELDVQIDVVPRLFEVLGGGSGFHGIEGLPLLSVRPAGMSRGDQLLKRAFDLAVSGIALTLLAPLFLAICGLIRLDSRGPAFFRQVRMGTDERPFRIFKFRTMVADAEERKSEVAELNVYRESGDARMFKAKDDPRVTRVGRLLRRLSLDELPQLINVFLGQMSLVGPRPLVLDEDRHVTDWGRARLRLRPGITGAWQALGRNGIPFDEMIRLDYHYVTNWSLLTDVVLLLRTIPAVLRARAVY